LAQTLALPLAAQRSEQRKAALWERLIALPRAADYQRAFASATGLSMRFAPTAGRAELERLSGSHCVLAGLPGRRPHTCTRKLRAMRLDPEANGVVACICCVGSVTEVLVPVLVGPVHVGNLVVGPFALRAPGARDCNTLGELLERCTPKATPGTFWDRLERLPVVTVVQYRTATTLAHLFGQYLSECGNRLVPEITTERAPLLQKITRYYAARGTDAVPLAELARHVGINRTHLCKRFKQETGLTLGAYRSRERIEKAKAMLLDRHRQVCEAAFAAGFGSITHFSRVFRRLVGCTPSAYRLSLAGPLPTPSPQRSRISAKKNRIRA
jgi:AraC-like DNA-binding protein